MIDQDKRTTLSTLGLVSLGVAAACLTTQATNVAARLRPRAEPLALDAQLIPNQLGTQAELIITNQSPHSLTLSAIADEQLLVPGGTLNVSSLQEALVIKSGESQRFNVGIDAYDGLLPENTHAVMGFPIRQNVIIGQLSISTQNHSQALQIPVRLQRG